MIKIIIIVIIIIIILLIYGVVFLLHPPPSNSLPKFIRKTNKQAKIKTNKIRLKCFFQLI